MNKQHLTNKDIEKYLKCRHKQKTPVAKALGRLIGGLVGWCLTIAVISGSIWLAAVAVTAVLRLFL